MKLYTQDDLSQLIKAVQQLGDTPSLSADQLTASLIFHVSSVSSDVSSVSSDLLQ